WSSSPRAVTRPISRNLVSSTSTWRNFSPPSNVGVGRDGGPNMTSHTTTPSPERQIARISVAAERHYLSAVLAFLRSASERMGLPPAEIAGLDRAVEEVCVNVVEHGFEPGQAGSFDVALLRRPGHLVVAVEDRGTPFDFATFEADTGSA